MHSPQQATSPVLKVPAKWILFILTLLNWKAGIITKTIGGEYQQCFYVTQELLCISTSDCHLRALTFLHSYTQWQPLNRTWVYVIRWLYNSHCPYNSYIIFHHLLNHPKEPCFIVMRCIYWEHLKILAIFKTIFYIHNGISWRVFFRTTEISVLLATAFHPLQTRRRQCNILPPFREIIQLPCKAEVCFYSVRIESFSFCFFSSNT